MSTESYNDIHYLEIETLSPVHVGSGRTCKKDMEFASYAPGRSSPKRAIAVLDHEKVFEAVGAAAIPAWIQAISNGQGTFDFLKRYKAGSQPVDFSLRVLRQEFPGEGPEMFREMILDVAGRPYLPGSSIKGAIRTALLAQGLLADQGQRPPDRTEDQVKAYFGKDMNSDVMRFIAPGDAHFTETACYALKILNRYHEEWKFKCDRARQEETLHVEAIPPGQKSCLRLVMPRQLKAQLRINKKHEVKTDHIYTLPGLLRQCHRQTLARIRAELQFWKEHEDPTITGDYCVQLEEILDRAERFDSDKEALLRVGFGVGWTGITGGWQEACLHPDVYAKKIATLPKVPGLLFPKTRKLAGGTQALGFVRLRVVPTDLRQPPQAVVAAATPPATPASSQLYHPGPVKVRLEVEACYAPRPGDTGPQKRFQLFLHGPGQEPEVLLRYPAELSPGQRATVRIKAVGKAGQIEAVEMVRLL